MKVFQAEAKPDGGLNMTDYQRATLKQFIKDNAGKRLRLVIDKLVPESRNQRKFYHGAVLCLWAYLDGNDYKSAEIMAHYHEIAKREFNTTLININGKNEKVGKSTKGDLNDGYLERIIDYLQKEYGIEPAKVLNPETYKKFRDQINLTGTYDTFIDYMRDLKILK